jgi:hypothetical protein
MKWFKFNIAKEIGTITKIFFAWMLVTAFFVLIVFGIQIISLFMFLILLLCGLAIYKIPVHGWSLFKAYSRLTDILSCLIKEKKTKTNTKKQKYINSITLIKCFLVELYNLQLKRIKFMSLVALLLIIAACIFYFISPEVFIFIPQTLVKLLNFINFMLEKVNKLYSLNSI